MAFRSACRSKVPSSPPRSQRFLKPLVKASIFRLASSSPATSFVGSTVTTAAQPQMKWSFALPSDRLRGLLATTRAGNSDHEIVV